MTSPSTSGSNGSFLPPQSVVQLNCHAYFCRSDFRRVRWRNDNSATTIRGTEKYCQLEHGVAVTRALFAPPGLHRRACRDTAEEIPAAPLTAGLTSRCQISDRAGRVGRINANDLAAGTGLARVGIRRVIRIRDKRLCITLRGKLNHRDQVRRRLRPLQRRYISAARQVLPPCRCTMSCTFAAYSGIQLSSFNFTFAIK